MMVGVNISDEQLGSIADRTIQEADQDGDSAISFAEFVKVSNNFQISKSVCSSVKSISAILFYNNRKNIFL